MSKFFTIVFTSLFALIFVCVGIGLVHNYSTLEHHETVVSSRGIFEAVEAFPNPISIWKEDIDALSVLKLTAYTDSSSSVIEKLGSFFQWFGGICSLVFNILILDPIKILVNTVGWFINLIPSIIGEPLWTGQLL